MHSRFYLSDVPIGVGVVGPGLIGGTFIDQLREQVRPSMVEKADYHQLAWAWWDG